MMTLKDIADLGTSLNASLGVYTDLDDIELDYDPLFIVSEPKSMHEFLTESYLGAEVKAIDARDDLIQVLIEV